MLNLLLYIINNIILIFTSITIIKLIDRCKNRWYDKIMKVGILYISQILIITLTCGLILKKLNLLWITAICIIMFIICIVIKIIKNITFDLKINFKYLKFTFKYSDNLTKGLIVILFFTLVLKLFNVFVLPPYSWDSMAYHLPNLVDYIQNGKIYISEKLIWSNCYPKNIEMLNLWQLSYFKNGITLALTQYSITILGSISIYGILNQLRIQEKYSLLGSIFYLSTPIILSQMSTTYIDTALCSIFVMCIYFLIISYHSNFDQNIIYLSLGLGVLLGIKYSSIGYYIIFMFFIFLLLIKSGKGLPNLAKIMLKIFIISMSIGSVWYIINLIKFKNPVYPFEIKVLNNVIFAGENVKASIMDSNTPYILRNKNYFYKILISWFQVGGTGLGPSSGIGSLTIKDAAKNFLCNFYDQRIGGFGLLWIIILVPSIFFFVLNKVKTRSIRTDEAIVLIIPTICFFITPSNWWTRYVCFILIVGIYCFCYLKDNYIKHKNIFLEFYIFLFIVIGCIQGSAYEIMYGDRIVLNNYLKGKDCFRSASSLFIDGEYKSILHKFNNSDSSLKILVFEVKTEYLYYFQGNNLQNNVKFYPYEKWNKNEYFIDEKKFDKVLKSNDADYIVVPNTYVKYNKIIMNNRYKLILKSKDGVLFYEKNKA